MEMGHVFKLGTIYSESMGVYYLDQQGERKPAVMGCYGIGVERMLAACIEANHDENGITWPAGAAPYDVHLVGLNLDQAPVAEALANIEAALLAAGLTCLIHDRAESAGVKFKDADLLGMPARVTASPRALEKGGVEVKSRRAAGFEVVPVADVVARVRDILGASGA